MSSSVFRLDIEDGLQKAMKEYEGDSSVIVQQVYKEYASEEIKQDIIGASAFPVSGRRFKGHARGAKETGPKLFSQEIAGLSLTVIARGKWGYLIFPDEGRGVHNPRAHHFMQAGLEKAAPDITERILAKLTE